MTATSGVRLTVDERQLRLLLRCVREASAAGLLRWDEVADVGDLVSLLDARLPSAEERHPAGRLAGHVLLGDEILRVLAAAEDRGRGGGRDRLMPDEVDRRVTGKPEGSGIGTTLDRLRRDGLISIGRGTGVCLTSTGRARARRPLASDPGEHAVIDAEQLLDLVARARCGGYTRYAGDDQVEVPAIWHVPTVQGCAGVDRETFDALIAALEADELIGPAEDSYRTITDAGVRLCESRARSQGLSGGLYGPRLLPPVRRPGEILRRREDTQCPICGRPASWLRTRSSKRHDNLRSSGMTGYDCTGCDVSWTVYAEPVDRAGHFDPFGDPVRCRARWALRGGYWGPALAPPDHWRTPP